MLYLIQVTIYTGLMLLLYLLLLRDRPMHRFNRGYLLSMAVVPLLLPLLKLPQAIRPQQPVSNDFINSVLPEVVITTGARAESAALPMWLLLSACVYLLIMLVIGVVKARHYIQLRRLIKTTEKEQQQDYILLKHTGYGPGSWGKYIFLPEGEVDAAIIRHEQQHIQLRHSRDMIFISCMQAVMWPNIFIHFIKKELLQVHEFQADAAVGVHAEEYSQLLLSSVFGTCTLPLTHSFIIHPIKRRIMMLYNNRKTSKARGVLAVVFSTALLAGIVTLQSCEQKMENEAATAQLQNKETQEDVLTFAHKMPTPEYNVGEALGKTIKYPQEAKEKGIEGKVPVKFIVDENGYITNIQAMGTKNDPLLQEAAVKAVAELPAWTPGEDENGNKVKVYFTLPIKFELPPDMKKKTSLNFRQKEITEKEYDVLTKAVKTNGKELLESSDESGSETYRLADASLTPEEIDHKLHNGGLVVTRMDRKVSPQLKKQTEEAKATKE